MEVMYKVALVEEHEYYKKLSEKIVDFIISLLTFPLRISYCATEDLLII
jgi:hypothetical protein